ncbi:MAG: type II secretion system protein [Patescibacteria group bacterium]
MKSKFSRGFTLIELLVVIAIIGVLSAVVLASLNTARSKGNDAGVKANLATVSTQAALYLSDNNNSYGTVSNGVCPASGTGNVFTNATIMSAINAALIDAGGSSTATCYATPVSYAVAVSRPAAVASTTSAYWCVDNSGERCGITGPLTDISCGTCLTRQ